MYIHILDDYLARTVSHEKVECRREKKRKRTFSKKIEFIVPGLNYLANKSNRELISL